MTHIQKIKNRFRWENGKPSIKEYGQFRRDLPGRRLESIFKQGLEN